MNAIFTVVFFLATILFLFVNPDEFLSSLLKGAEKAALLSLSLLTIYCIWLGFFKVMEKSGLSEKLAKKLFPLTKKLFRSNDQEAVYLAGCNLSANFLGLPGAPTPLGIRATEKFYSKGNEFAADMLFVLNATSLQLLPTTVIALRVAAGSSSPSDIFLPTLLATLVSTLLGVLLLLLFSRKKSMRKRLRVKK